MQYAGFTCMPIVGGFLSHVMGSEKIPLIGQFLVLTQFTAPAFFLSVFAIVLYALLYFVFKDGKLGKGGEGGRRRDSVEAKRSNCRAREAVSCGWACA